MFAPYIKITPSVFTWLSLSALSISLLLPAVSLPAKAQIIQSATPVTSSVALPTDDTIDALIEEIMADRQIPGLSLAVIHDQKLIKTAGYGLLNREQTVKVRPSSLFPIASISKPLTATAIMLLVEDGKIDLDAPVSTYLASAPVTWEGITVRHLLTHTAGLSEEVYSQDMGELLSSHGFVAAAGQLPLDFQPGESWMYSNTGYNLLATIVENVSEQSFSTFLETRIFEPVGMDATDVIRDSYRGSNVAMGYVSEGSAIEPIDFNFGFVPEIMTLFRGSGSVTSTVLDLARWAMSLQKGQLLSAETQAEMEQLGLMNSGLAADYGLGWFIRNINGHQIVSHGGNLWGYSTGLSQFPDDKLTIVVLTNKDGEQGEDIALKIAEQYIPELVIDRNGPALSDSNPGLTAQLFAFLQGDAAAIALTPERELSLSTPRGSYRIVQWEQYVSRHQVAALEVIDQAPHPNGLELYYRIQTSDEVHLLRVVVTPDDLIAGMNVRLDD